MINLSKVEQSIVPKKCVIVLTQWMNDQSLDLQKSEYWLSRELSRKIVRWFKVNYDINFLFIHTSNFEIMDCLFELK